MNTRALCYLGIYDWDAEVQRCTQAPKNLALLNIFEGKSDEEQNKIMRDLTVLLKAVPGENESFVPWITCKHCGKPNLKLNARVFKVFFRIYYGT